MRYFSKFQLNARQPPKPFSTVSFFFFSFFFLFYKSSLYLLTEDFLPVSYARRTLGVVSS